MRSHMGTRVQTEHQHQTIKAHGFDLFGPDVKKGRIGNTRRPGILHPDVSFDDASLVFGESEATP